MNDRKKHSLGIDLGGTKVEVGLMNSLGQLIESRKKPTRVLEGPEAIVKDIAESVSQIRSEHNTPIAGVGVGMAGQIDAESGMVYFAPNLKWKDIPLQAMLHEALKLPVVVTNDVRAVTWAEWLYGSGKNSSDLICIFIGTGVGSGVVSGGNLLTGFTNSAGEIGHMTIDLHGADCTCGNRGCLETLAAGWGIARRAREAALKDSTAGQMLVQSAGSPEAISARQVIQCAQAGDALSVRIMSEAAEALIAATVSVVNAFNPQFIILGGGIIQGMPELIQKIEIGVRKRALKTATSQLKIVRAALKEDAGVIGAATLALNRF